VDGHHPEGDREGPQVEELQHSREDDEREEGGDAVHEGGPAEGNDLSAGGQGDSLESKTVDP